MTTQPTQPTTDPLRDIVALARAGLRQVAVGPEVPHPRGTKRTFFRRHAQASLLVATVVGFFIMLPSVDSAWHLPGPLQPLLALAQAVPIALLARRPLLAWRITFVFGLLTPLLPPRDAMAWPWDPAQILLLLLVYTVAAFRHPRQLLVWFVTGMVFLLWIWSPREESPGIAIGGTIAVVVIAVVADSVRTRRRAQDELTAETERTELEKARRAVLEERTRIARELHDVVAHHMSLIAVQAETAPYRLTGLSEPAQQEFTAISAAARQSLAEMRRLLGVLRSEQSAERAPQPGLGDLPELVATARRAGMLVELTSTDTPDDVPPTVALSAYRVVQEALSNASRHAPGAAVSVTVAVAPDAVRMRIVNGPATAAAASEQTATGASADAPTGASADASSGAEPLGPGHGLLGMRERVEPLGGELRAEPTSDGGFLVAVTIPANGDR